MVSLPPTFALCGRITNTAFFALRGSTAKKWVRKTFFAVKYQYQRKTCPSMFTLRLKNKNKIRKSTKINYSVSAGFCPMNRDNKIKEKQKTSPENSHFKLISG
ncbi:CLUMA_CG004667, isoform A [Clunio marinus]|uniref:CLUMA_CG004667, isoform A n=1 Tax=Clunio marinus TaxID=568069 RepID=A0A1J1HTU3_9DIPT|nr:CLUMA_CG004667, isoform A [Clunio marinus]